MPRPASLLHGLLSLLLCAALTACQPSSGADGDSASAGGSSDAPTLLVEAACGECQFGLPGDGCDLAVRVNGKAYFVSGTTIDDHGDAHAEDGFCKSIRSARVVGHVDGDRFAVTSFELVP